MLTQLLDALKAGLAVGGGALLIVVLTEVGEVPLEYSMEFLTATGRMNSWNATEQDASTRRLLGLVAPARAQVTRFVMRQK